MKKWKSILSIVAVIIIFAPFSIKEAKAATSTELEVQRGQVSSILPATDFNTVVKLDSFSLLKTVVNVPPDKKWTITFGQVVDMSTIGIATIGVVDEGTKEKIEVEISSAEEGRKVSVALAEGRKYSYGHTYQLYLTNGVKSKLNKSLKPIKIKFTIMQEPTEKNTMYNIVREALLQVKKEVNISRAEDFDSTSIEEMIGQVYRENPLVLYLASYTIYSDGKIQFQYKMDAQTTFEHIAAIQAKTKEIIANEIKPDMDDYQKEKAIHDYIIRNAVYDVKGVEDGNIPPEDYSAYGVLINGVGVCESYAEAMQYIMQQLGIDCRIVEGTGYDGNGKWIAHEWNVIFINGSWYQLDLTWDDPITSNKENILSYRYFNITDAEMRKDHKYTENYPASIAIKENYYYKNELIIKDYKELYNKIADAIRNRKETVEMKSLNYLPSQYNIKTAVGGVLKEDAITSVSYRTQMDGNILNIRFLYN